MTSLLHKFHTQGIPWPFSLFYDALTRHDIFQQHYRLVAREAAAICSQGKILDVGTGPGWLLLALSRAASQAAVEGVDISAGMVDLARRHMEKAGQGAKIVIRQGSVSNLPYPDNSFDLVLSTGSLHHWREPQAGLNEVYRVLRPGGRALIYDLVKKLPDDVAKKALVEFGRFRLAMLWLHSFEEPFYEPVQMEQLAAGSLFGRGSTRFTGALCCLDLKK